MKLKTAIGLVLPCLTLLAASLQAAEVAATPRGGWKPPAEGATTIAAVITPRLFVFDYFDGVGEDKTHFLERYDYREGFSGDTRSGVFADLDLDVTANNGERDLFVLERRGFGQYNHRGAARYSNDALSVYGTYSHYRSATGGIDYLFSPGQVAGGTTSGGGRGFSTFNDDANRYDYIIDRTTYSAGFKVKPAVLGGSATVAVDYEGYTRDGNKFAPFLLDSIWRRWRWWRLGPGTLARHQPQCRRAHEQGWPDPDSLAQTPVRDSPMRCRTSSSSAMPPNCRCSATSRIRPGCTVPAGTSPVASLFYVPDTNLVKQALKVSKNFSDRVLVVAGYGASWLKQDSISQLELASGHTQGQINTNNAYLTANAYVTPRRVGRRPHQVLQPRQRLDLPGRADQPEHVGGAADQQHRFARLRALGQLATGFPRFQLYPGLAPARHGARPDLGHGGTEHSAPAVAVP